MRFGDALIERIEAVANPVVTDAGCELVDLAAVTEHGRNILRLFIDKPGGVTIDDCASVSRELGAALDVEEIIPGRYSLEVSSPGLDRVLKKEDDFRRFAGSRVKIKTLQPIEGRNNFKVTLQGVSGNAVVVMDETERRWEIKLENIKRANLVPEL